MTKVDFKNGFLNFKEPIPFENKTEDPSVVYAGNGYVRNPKELCES